MLCGSKVCSFLVEVGVKTEHHYMMEPAAYQVLALYHYHLYEIVHASQIEHAVEPLHSQVEPLWNELVVRFYYQEGIDIVGLVLALHTFVLALQRYPSSPPL